MNQIKVSEAIKKICPFMVDVVMQNPTATMGPSYPRNICCIASACMAWEYTINDHIIHQDEKPDDSYTKVANYNSHHWKKELPEEDKFGKCLRLSTKND